jgi:hypothetical protein
MTDKPRPRPARRIAVALDASEQSLRLMALAGGIAAALEAELEGVFVEDADLLRLAGLPFLREFRLTTRGEAAVDAERLQRELRATARRVRESVERSAQRLGCAWSFRVWRGDLEAEILSAALDAEMFTLAPLGRHAPLLARPSAAPRPRTEGALTVAVLFDGSAEAARALATGAELTTRRHAALAVILQAPDAAGIERLREQAKDLLGKEAGARVQLVSFVAGTAKALAETALRLGSDLLLVHAANPLLAAGGLWRSLGALGCPVLLVR